MQDVPYFCPNCRSNRVKFSFIRQVSQDVMKDAISGEITEQSEEGLLDELVQVRCREIGRAHV